jgi:hypothetical protein
MIEHFVLAPVLRIEERIVPDRNLRKGIDELLRIIADPSDKRVPDACMPCRAGQPIAQPQKADLRF